MIAGIILIKNIEEPAIQIPELLKLKTKIIQNQQPLGFAANHNAAFKLCSTPYFAVLNPDIRIPEDPFPYLIECINDSNTALVAPAVLNSNGDIEDNARRFPSLIGLFVKALGLDYSRVSYAVGDETFYPDWVAGMFLFLDSSAFEAVGKFDSKFHLYYEDVDLSVRLKKMRKNILLCPKTYVIHDAQRTSRRNIQYFIWHLSSMFRFFLKHWGRLP